MILLLIKILAFVFTALVIIKSYLAFRKREESLVMFLFWSITWLVIITVAFYPAIINRVLGEGRVGVGSLLAVAVVFVYFVVYRIYVKADRLEKQLHSLIRQLAIHESTKPKRIKKATDG
jgi:hypothetical protein